MKSRESKIYNLEDFGLDLDSLLALGKRKVKLRAHIRYPKVSSIFPLPPDERKRKTDQSLREKFQSVKKRWPAKEFEIIGTKIRPSGIEGEVEAQAIAEILTVREFDHIWIESVQGRKRSTVPDNTLYWFGVKAIFAIQVEGKKTGLQTYEERIVILKAKTFEDAERRVLKEFKAYGNPYLNGDGEMVRWQFEKILDTYAIQEEELDPKGTEVFSVLKGRRMKPEYEWHPRSERKNKKR